MNSVDSITQSMELTSVSLSRKEMELVKMFNDWWDNEGAIQDIGKSMESLGKRKKRHKRPGSNNITKKMKKLKIN